MMGWKIFNPWEQLIQLVHDFRRITSNLGQPQAPPVDQTIL